MHNIVKLNKFIYGFRNLRDRTIKSFGFIQLKTDESVYKFSTNTSYLILGVFVDVILCLGTHPGIIQWLKYQMSSQFSITIKSSFDSFLGMQIYHNRSSRTICLSQPGYIVNLMSRFGIDISSCKIYFLLN